MILLIPGRLWDNAMSKLGPKNDVQLIEGVQIMNGKWDNNELKYIQEYDIRKPASFGQWLKVSLENEEFKKVQQGILSSSNIVVPTIKPSTHPIHQPIIQPIQATQPFLSNIIRPHNASTNYIATGINSFIDNESMDNICSMRIISRPR